MRHLPVNNYNGLTIVLSQPSRFDLKSKKLISGNAGYFFESEVLAPLKLDRYECDIRSSDTISEGIIFDTKCILLLGEPAFHQWTNGYTEYKLSEQRGYPLANDFNIATFSSFTPQDCCDIKDYESIFNPALSGSSSEAHDEDSELENEEDQK